MRAIRKQLKAHWKQLQMHGDRLSAVSCADLFAADSRRFDSQSLQRSHVLADLSREVIDDAAWDSLLLLPDSLGLAAAAEQLLSGKQVNISEQRAALHPACRALALDGLDDGLPQPPAQTMADLAEQREAMLIFAQRFRAGELHTDSGRTVRCLVNLGIGGADLGVRLILQAFGHLLPEGMRVYCAADEEELRSLLGQLDAEETFFIVNSKSFATRETMTAAALAGDWLRSAVGKGAWPGQMAAVTARPERASQLGLPDSQIYPLMPEIGGRYSLWSAAGLAAAAVLGREAWLELLAGAREADGELISTDWRNNLIVRLALKDIWHSQVRQCASKAFFPYRRALRGLVPYLGQLEMESLGKNLLADGTAPVASSGSIFWGGWGPSAQHSLFQMLYQGTHRVPVELLAVAADPATDSGYALCLTQAEALSAGSQDSWEKARQVPVTLQVLSSLTPQAVGFLLGCWEHRVFVQAQILGINPFDQWGVERGKRLAERTDYGDAAGKALADWGRNKAR